MQTTFRFAPVSLSQARSRTELTSGLGCCRPEHASDPLSEWGNGAAPGGRCLRESHGKRPHQAALPSRCSKNQSRFSGSRVIQSSTNASTCGRMGSMRSQARLSRARAYRHAVHRGQDQAQSQRQRGVLLIRGQHRGSSRSRLQDSQQGEVIQITAICAYRTYASGQAPWADHSSGM